MPYYDRVVRKQSRPYLESLRDDLALRKNPDFFWPTGTQVYCGMQGSGKTVSAVKHLLDMKQRYPKAIVVTNIALKYLEPLVFDTAHDIELILEIIDPAKQYIQFTDATQLATVLVSVNNDFYGVIYLIDEIHTYFNALDSKNIPMYVFTEISQQRKQRKVIIGTSQLFTRMAKPLREQCDNIIMCNTIGGIITTQAVWDGTTLTVLPDDSLAGNLKRRGWFFHTRRIRNAFDTYQKVVSSADQLGMYEQQPVYLAKKKGKKLEIL